MTIRQKRVGSCIPQTGEQRWPRAFFDNAVVGAPKARSTSNHWRDRCKNLGPAGTRKGFGNEEIDTAGL
jgi:hypothetical protein